MPPVIENNMLAPCGMVCTVCYVHVGMRKRGKRCPGCLHSDEGKPEHCRRCKIKDCAAEKGHTHCHQCGSFPCALVKRLERSYNQRYSTSLVANSRYVRQHGVEALMRQERQKWLCQACGGAFSLHDGICSECGAAK